MSAINGKDDMFPVALAADVETGEVYSLRTDLTFLRIVEKVPVGGTIRLTYTGLGKKKGKRNAVSICANYYATSPAGQLPLRNLTD